MEAKLPDNNHQSTQLSNLFFVSVLCSLFTDFQVEELSTLWRILQTFGQWTYMASYLCDF